MRAETQGNVEAIEKTGRKTLLIAGNGDTGRVTVLLDPGEYRPRQSKQRRGRLLVGQGRIEHRYLRTGTGARDRSLCCPRQSRREHAGE